MDIYGYLFGYSAARLETGMSLLGRIRRSLEGVETHSVGGGGGSRTQGP